MPRALPVIDLTAPICCAPVAAGRMDDAEALEVALRLKALADPTRVRLMSMLLTEGELCTCDLAAEIGLSDATVSHHLAQLRKAGLVEGTRRGTNVWYRARPESLRALGRVLDPAPPADVPTGAADRSGRDAWTGGVGQSRASESTS